MKKQLLTGALALSVLMGTSGMALAADMPAVEMTKAISVNVKTDSVADALSDHFKISDMKTYTAESYATEIEEAKTGFDQMVKDKQMTREDADKIIDQMEQNLQEIKAGTLDLTYYDMLDEDGNIIGKISLTSESSDGTDIKTLNEDAVQTDAYTIKVVGDDLNVAPLDLVVPVQTAK